MDNDICPAAVRKLLRQNQTGAKRYTTRAPGHSIFVLPVWQYSCKIDSSETTVCGGRGFLPSKVTLQKFFPIEPAFAITVHKSEGRTMDRVIIALSSCSARGCDFSYAQFHVAFSRVRKGDHIRLFLTGDNEVQQWESLLYLHSLAPKPSIQYYFGGFRRINDYASPNEGWLTNSWERGRANSGYRELHGLQ